MKRAGVHLQARERTGRRALPGNQPEVELDREAVVAGKHGFNLEGIHRRLKLSAAGLQHRADRLQHIELDGTGQRRQETGFQHQADSGILDAVNAKIFELDRASV